MQKWGPGECVAKGEIEGQRRGVWKKNTGLWKRLKDKVEAVRGLCECGIGFCDAMLKGKWKSGGYGGKVAKCCEMMGVGGV